LTFSVDDRPGGGPLGWVRRQQLAIPLDLPATDAVDRLLRFRPKVLSGHPHRLLDVGRSLPDRWRPESLITHGEALDPWLRAELEEVYGVVPRDGYGTTEVGPVAWQCRRADLHHVQVESVLVEILDDQDVPAESGQEGNVVVTGLRNRLMPFVRYRLADRAALADRPCACGYSGPALARIVGRTTDFVLDGRGAPISPERLWLYSHIPAETIQELIRRYQVHQRSDGTIEMRLEVRRPLPERLRNEILAAYRSIAAGQPVELNVLDDLGELRPGKFRLISSELARRDAGRARKGT
jgi:phenylacetate-CoA ligase